MKSNDPVRVLAWLQRKPSLEQLRAEFPAQWAATEKELAAALEKRDPKRLHRLLQRPSGPARSDRKTTLAHRDKWALVQSAVTQRMAALAIERYSIAVATGRSSGRLRFNLFNGLLAQWLFFDHGFVRKPVSMFWFRLIWPLLPQKRLLMPLVERKGIYCFYSKKLIARLSALIAGRSTLEIGAGDGTLSRFLVANGVPVTATDDHSWADRITYPEHVVRMDASAALRQWRPQVVICCWPPSQNSFEREVFRSPGVELYVVILSAHEFATGNWNDYRTQDAFELEMHPDLSRMVLPTELGCEVLLFRRKPG